MQARRSGHRKAPRRASASRCVALELKGRRHVQGDLTGAALVAAMEAAPHREIDVEPKRSPMPVRAVRLNLAHAGE
jgi:hypothetical protein